MSLQTRLTALTQRIGQEIKELRALVESSDPPTAFGLINNPSFETWTNATDPAGWGAFWSVGSPVRSQSPGRTGTHSLGVSFGPGVDLNQRLTNQVIPVQPNQLFYIEAWARREVGDSSIELVISSGTGPLLGPFGADETGVPLAQRSIISVPIGQWQKFGAFFTVPSDATFILPQVIIISPSGDSKTLLDDVSLTPVAVPASSIDPEVGGTRNNNDYYEKYPDGRLVCLGRRSFPANANTGQAYTWNFPVSFAGEIPQVDIISSTSVPQNISLGIVDEALSSVSIRFFRTTGSATTVFFSATGRWK